MFRAQQNAFDDVVAKATDENLTSENWEFIMDVCDKVQGEDSGGKDAVASMIKRLAHRNANVQLYTLELANALSQNCETKMHRELASRAFTDALLRVANDRNTHTQVKAKILERMAEWAQMFSKDPGLGIMNDQYHKLKSQNPNLHPPSAPSKSRLTDLDRQKEDEELQMALKLSIQDKSQAKTAQNTSDAGPSELPVPAASQPLPSGTTPATVSRVRALFDFIPTEAGELEFKKGDIIAVLESVFKDWWKGSLRGHIGIFPLNYVEKLADPTPDELEREARMEAEVFAEIKNVEKLLTLLSTSSGELRREDNEEITQLYHKTVAIRPKLIELIGKYSQKKDDFTQLNEKFIKARRDYEALLEHSMSQPQQPYQYGRPSHVQHGYGGGGGYPPQNAPPQQDPARYYTPGPQEPQQTYPQKSSPPANYPPRNGPAPFYIVGGQGQPPQAPQQSYSQQPQGPPQGQQQGYPQRDPTPRVPSGSKPTPTPLQTSTSPPPSQYPPMHPQTGHRPQSTYEDPQELATTSYDSPVGQAPNSQYSASVYSEDPYSAEGHANQLPPSQQQYNIPPPAQNAPPPPQQYAAYVPPQQHPSRPTYEPPPPPGPGAVPNPVPMNGGPGYPILGGQPPPDARQGLPSQIQGGGQYKAYQRHENSAAPGAPSAADFYRQATN